VGSNAAPLPKSRRIHLDPAVSAAGRERQSVDKHWRSGHFQRVCGVAIAKTSQSQFATFFRLGSGPIPLPKRGKIM
jgi:hypothetical protein